MRGETVMELIRTKAKFVSIFMAFLMFLIAVPCQSIFAAMIATDVTFESARAHKSREDLQQLKDANKLKISENEISLGDLRGKQEEQIATSQPIIDGFDGLMARINAIGKLAWLPSFFILLLFLAIETAPVLAKLLAPKGAYDMKFQDQEEALLVWVTQQKNQRVELLKTDSSLNEKV